jgi:hypothetical protein
MTSPARSATSDITPTEALSMINGHFRHLPIVSRQGEWLAILSIRHLLHWRSDDLSHELDAREQYFANDSLGVRFATGIERRHTKEGPLRWTRKKEEQEKLDRLIEELRSSATQERLCRGSRKLAQAHRPNPKHPPEPPIRTAG